MSIYATIYNDKIEPLTNSAEFEAVSEIALMESQAEEFAACGTKCCIMWTRDSDGQVAYWGLGGATFEPHWYAYCS